MKSSKNRAWNKSYSKSSKEMSQDEGIEPQFIHFKTNLLCHQDVYKRLADMRKVLSDLRERQDKGITEDSKYWKAEMCKMEEENDRAWKTRLDRMELQLTMQEEEIARLHSSNAGLQRRLDADKTANHPHALLNGKTDSAFEDDEECVHYKASSPTLCAREECERLEEQLSRSEQQVDQLNLTLNQKLIEINKLQLTLSRQTKEMAELEKSYLQLQCRLKRNAAKPMGGRLCTNNFSIKPMNLIPKSSPPMSPTIL